MHEMNMSNNDGAKHKRRRKRPEKKYNEFDP